MRRIFGIIIIWDNYNERWINFKTLYTKHWDITSFILRLYNLLPLDKYSYFISLFYTSLLFYISYDALTGCTKCRLSICMMKPMKSKLPISFFFNVQWMYARVPKLFDSHCKNNLSYVLFILYRILHV